MPSRKVARVASRIRFLVSSAVQSELKDPRLGFVTILRVEPTEDLREAKVYYSVLGDENVKSRTDRALQQARGFIQRLVGKGLETRSTPQLRFVLDESQERQAHVEDLIERAIQEDSVRGEGESEDPDDSP